MLSHKHKKGLDSNCIFLYFSYSSGPLFLFTIIFSPLSRQSALPNTSSTALQDFLLGRDCPGDKGTNISTQARKHRNSTPPLCNNLGHLIAYFQGSRWTLYPLLLGKEKPWEEVGGWVDSQPSQVSDLTPRERCVEDALTECVWAGGKCFCITFMTQELCHLAICARCCCLMVITGFYQGVGESTPMPLQ